MYSGERSTPNFVLPGQKVFLRSFLILFSAKFPAQRELGHPTSLMYLVNPYLTNVTGQFECQTRTLGKPGGKVTMVKADANFPPTLLPISLSSQHCLAFASITIHVPEVILN